MRSCFFLGWDGATIQGCAVGKSVFTNLHRPYYKEGATTHWPEPSSFRGEDPTFRRGSFLGGEGVTCSGAAATQRPQCTSQSIASASGLVFDGAGGEREQVADGASSRPQGGAQAGGLLQARAAKFCTDCL